MADFDPFANQGGPAAWDPEHDDDSRAKAEELLRGLGDSAGAEPGDFGTGQDAEAAQTDAGDEGAPDEDSGGEGDGGPA